VCTNAQDMLQLSKPPETLSVSFTYEDPAPIVK
jgi:hypothetical protein